jgi:TetR/AcrR family transcriptional regulator
MSEKEKATEELILDAAMKVFTRRGFAATRTEDVAKEAGISRTLLHYYYRDKQTMFDIIFETRFQEFFKGVFSILASEAALLEKIKLLVDHEIGTLSKHPDLPRFVIGEIAQQPERLIQYGQKMNVNPRLLLEKFTKQVKEEVSRGSIVPIDGRQLLMNIISLCVYPFVAKPIIKTMMQLDENTFLDLMDQRKKEVYEFIIKGIKTEV